MTGKEMRRVPHGVLLGTAKWLPLLLVIFSVFLFETSLQLRIFEADYAQVELNGRVQEIKVRINLLEQQEDRLARMERIDIKASDLGLVQPEPNQIEYVTTGFDSSLRRHASPNELARLAPSE
ncbi:MAG: hypothetical protein JXR94_06870 [Candidatus Hydrogenedentes bacterium]|nr:hypothetical protein [Candidatus Hydrogenedentota bacterium]